MTVTLTPMAVGDPPRVLPARQRFTATVPEAPWNDRLAGGLEWLAEETFTGGTEAIMCLGNTDSIQSVLNAAVNRGRLQTEPFAYWVSDICSTLDRSRDRAARVRAQLAATGSYRIAKEVWSGAVAQADVITSNHWLTENPDVLATNQPVATAVGLIDQALGEMLKGARGMLHVSPQVLDRMQAAAVIARLGGTVWETAMGTPVVADAGYPGDGPDEAPGTKQWIYATAPMQYMTSPMFLVPPLDNDGVQATVRTTNKTVVTAWQVALVQWDYEVPADLTDGDEHPGVLAVETDITKFAGLTPP